MTCNCKKEIEEMMLAKSIVQYPEATDHKVSLSKGYSLIIDRKSGDCRDVARMPFEITAVFPLKNGNRKSKTIKMSMFFSFCPFCGVKYEEQIA